MEYFAGHCGAVAAITQPAYAELISANCRGLRWIAVTSHDAGSTPAQGAPRGDSFESLFADSADRPRRTADPFAPCSVQYTSGTTSRPKAVLWTHANALWGAKINAAHEDLHADDVHQTYLPLFHTNALAYSMLATLWVGASSDPAAVFGEPVLGRGAGTQLHLDLDDPLLHEGAAGTRDS
jgi:crotonobetaine/carnitine-CoA ligase